MLSLTRRHFISTTSRGLGAAALWSLLGDGAHGARNKLPGVHFPARAKRIIYLFQSGAPSQMDLFDYKPALDELRASELPDSIRQGQRLTGMTATQESFPIAPSIFKFAQRGRSGAWVSDLMPHTAKIVDRLCFIKSMHTEAIKQEP